MKKNDYSYKNLYRNLKQESKSNATKKQLPSQNKIKENNKVVRKKYINQSQSEKDKQNQTNKVNRIYTETGYISKKQNCKTLKQCQLYNMIQQQEKNRMRYHIDKLQQQLQKKIIDNGFMNYFKTENSSATLSHLDIYLQLISLEQVTKNKQKIIKDLEKNLKQSNQLLQSFFVTKQDYQNKLKIQEQQIINLNSIIAQQMASIKNIEETDSYYQKYIEIKYLFDQTQKRTLCLMERIEQLEKQQQQYKNKTKSNQQQIKSLKDEVEKFALRCQQFSSQQKQLIENQIKYKKELQNLKKKIRDLEFQTKQLNIIHEQKLYGMSSKQHNSNTEQKTNIQHNLFKQNKLLQQQLKKRFKQRDNLTYIIKQYQSQIQELTIKSQYQKKVNFDKQKHPKKIKQIISNLQVYIPQRYVINYTYQDADQLYQSLIQINELIITLANQCIVPLQKEIESQKTNIMTLQLEKQYIEESKKFQNEIKQQAIEILMKFIPIQLRGNMQQYLNLVQDLTTNCTTQTIEKRIYLLENIRNASTSYLKKKLEQSIKKNENYKKFESMQQQLKPSQIKQNKTSISSVEKYNNKDIIKKYFE